ncbi:MAG: T9SS type A sorting domain-containing protein [Calditrichaeota bacterium]|nr:T9SS type A sorting domain-containing protein [Calditrichota bacterium]
MRAIPILFVLGLISGILAFSPSNSRPASRSDLKEISPLQEVGRWPDGICTTAITDGDSLAFVGNGSAVDILAIASLPQFRLLGRILLPSLPQDMAYQNHRLYVLTNNDGLLIYDVANPAQPTFLGQFDIGDVPRAVAVQGDYAFVTYMDYGLAVVDVRQPTQPVEVGSHDVAGNPQGLFIRDTLAFVTRGWNGLRVFNITNPTNPVPLGEIDTYEDAYDVFVQGNYAYVADLSGIEVIDVSDPASLSATKRLALDWGIMEIVGDGSNRLYTIALDYGIKEIDISDPADIRLSREYRRVPGWGIWKQQSLLFVAGYREGLHVLETAYTDSLRWVAGYATACCSRAVDVDGRYLYVANGENGFYVVDLQASPHPRTVGHWRSRDASVSVAVDGSIAYVADQQGFLRKLDVSRPDNPTEIGYFDYGQQLSMHHVQVGDRFVYASAGYNGWFAVKKSGTGALEAAMFWSASDVFVYQSYILRDTLAFIAGGGAGLFILNIADTSQVIQLSQFTEPYINVSTVFATDRFAYFNNYNYLYILDISDSTQPQKVGEYAAENIIRGIYARDNRVYLADDWDGVLVLDVSDPANPTLVANFKEIGDAIYGVHCSGDTIFAAGGQGGVYLLKEPVTAITGKQRHLPATFQLLPNFPNPFNPVTHIVFELPHRADVDLSIFTITGQRIRTLVRGERSAGRYRVQWDGRDERGQPVSSGVYFYRLKAGTREQVRKMILLR